MSFRRYKGPGWLRQPALHFLLAGAALFGLDAARSPARPPAGTPVVITAERQDTLREAFALRNGTRPTASEMRGLIDGAVDEELLYREALALGLDRGEPAVRMRLIQKARFVSDGEGRTDEALHREARALGLDREDPVLRRILAEKMRLLLAGAGRPEPLTDAELSAWLSRHRARFTSPPRLRFSQVFLGTDRRGARVERDARRLLASLRARAIAPEGAAGLGDPFPMGDRNAWIAQPALASLLGDDFASRALGLSPGAWQGPIRSPYGRHLVWVHEKRGAVPEPLSAVRARVAQGLLAERREARVRAGIARLRAGAEIRVERESLRAQGPGERGGRL
jgi:hypothetical protein